MSTSLNLLAADPLDIAFFQVDASDQFPPGFVHEKVVPFGIIAQATEGRYEISCGGVTALVSGDEAFLTPANVPLRIVHHASGKGFAAHWIHFSFVLFQSLEVTSLLDLPLKIDARHGREIGPLIVELRGMVATDPVGDTVTRLSKAARQREIAWRVLGAIFELARPRDGAFDYVETGKRLQPLLQHLDQHLEEPIDVSRMARLVHMSPSRLHAYFRERLDATPMGYLSALRLKRAAALLSEFAPPSVKQVATETGFASASHLSREFKRRYGVSPTGFRERGV